MPPKSIKGKERLAIEPPKPKPKSRRREPYVEQIEAPAQVPVIEAPPKPAPKPIPKPGALVVHGKDKATGTLRGTVNSVIRRYNNTLALSDAKYDRYRKDVNAIFDEYNNNPRYFHLTSYDVTRMCMTEVDNYLYRHEPVLFQAPRIYSQRWELAQNIAEHMYAEQEPERQPYHEMQLVPFTKRSNCIFFFFISSSCTTI